MNKANGESKRLKMYERKRKNMKKFFKVLTSVVVAFMLCMCVNSLAFAEEITGETTGIKLTKYSELDQKAQDFNSGLVGGNLVAYENQEYPFQVYKINVPEDGKYRINYNTIENTGVAYDNLHKLLFVLYSNPLMTKQVDSKQMGGTSSANTFSTLEKGTYYLKVKVVDMAAISPKFDSTFSVSFGYLPVKTSMFNVVKTVNSVNQTVSLKVSLLDGASIWVSESSYAIDHMESDAVWGGDELLSGNVYTVTKNGTYGIRAKDIYGNIYGTVVTINDFTVPSVPKITQYKSGTKTIRGGALANSTVTVNVNKKAYSTKANAKGIYTVNLKSALKVGNKISVTVKSPMGVVSSKASAVVKNRKIAAPKVTRYKRNTRLVKGTAKKGTTVYVKAGKKTYKGKVSSKGSYSVKVAKLKKGTAVKVMVKDSYGNSSNYKTVKVK